MHGHDPSAFKGADDLTKVHQLISKVFMPMESSNANVRTLLDNFSKTVKESITQLTGSKAIDVPTHIEPNDERAIRDRDTLAYYRSLLVPLNSSRPHGHKRSRKEPMIRKPKHSSSAKLLKSLICGEQEALFLVPFFKTSPNQSLRQSLT
jgi:hypothetical protein